MPWHAKKTGAYSRDSVEAQDNAKMIWGLLNSRGWTLNAVCGVLGNLAAESGYNPWRWQSDSVGVSTGSPWTNKGYGFVQFTPASKYIDAPEAKAIQGYGPNFSDRPGNVGDGYAQFVYVDGYADYIPTSRYPISYADFKKSTDNPGTLARVWLYNYERPGDPAATEEARASNGEWWYTLLSGGEPPDPPEPPPVSGELPIWIYFKFHERR